MEGIVMSKSMPQEVKIVLTVLGIGLLLYLTSTYGVCGSMMVIGYFAIMSLLARI
jgi:hypothetical protein